MQNSDVYVTNLPVSLMKHRQSNTLFFSLILYFLLTLITILEDTLSANPLRLEDGNELSISVSIGASHYPEDGANADELYKRPDERMYRMKKDAIPNT
ncbi:diguanylate cyclase domain-containing protein [Paenibacillus sp. PL91]|uniref:diguanylate cyclase domain-containing protein n=1 Tax=Paenibacillus sp. PL91 TaxID=2729538 RepID=UPI00145CA978|nr:diguanylate cyclase [Paenibacillus sp. PL91]MBC9199246.1 diguanylate cyclase [Paenibacillus sp. PL91]